MKSLINSHLKFSLFLLLIILMQMTGCNGNANLPATLPATVVPVTPSIPTSTPYDPMPQASEGFYWWNNVIFYEIFVRSFYDSNGDGIGDLNGITQKLDYLNDGDPATDSDLGINGIWLMPIFPASSYHGYDVTDYFDVNPQYGNLQDLQTLLAEAHKRGIRVVIDFVINHTSSKHPWFVDARSGSTSSYRDWYIWSEENPGYSGPWGERVWHFNYDNSYYYGVFTAEMPDLNFTNPEVTQEVYKIANFWIEEVGVDGFRVDGARHLIEEGQTQANSSATYSWFEQFQSEIDLNNPDFLTVGEVWDNNFSAAKYVKEEAFDLVFDFELSESILEGLNRDDGKKIANALEFNRKLFPPLQKANFLTNHDMNRVMDTLFEDVEKAKLAAILLVTSPGVPFVYYGEELGMTGSKPDEDIRKPMQWDSSGNGGFSSGAPWRPLNSAFELDNVEVQRVDQGSLFNLYRRLIHLRNDHSALRTGEFFVLDSQDAGVVAFLRQSSQETILIVINTGKNEVPLSLDIPPGILTPGQYTISSLFSSFSMIDFEIEVGGSNFLIQSEQNLQPQDYLLLDILKN